jgi:hypothetical protein
VQYQSKAVWRRSLDHTPRARTYKTLAAELEQHHEAMALPTVTVRSVLEELIAYGLAACDPQGQGKPSLWR